MRSKRYRLHDMGNRVIDIGRQGENEATTIDFDVSSWVNEYPDGIITAAIKTPGGDIRSTSVHLNGNDLVWPITEKETKDAGKGSIEITLLRGNEVVKSRVAEFSVSHSITGRTPGDAETPGEPPTYLLFPVELEMLDPNAQGYGQLDTSKLALHIPRGEPGKDYVLTEMDKNSIIDAVLSVYPTAEEASF